MIKYDKKSTFIREHVEFKSILEANKITKLDEETKNNMSIDVAKRVYEIAAQKIPSIDFGDIPLSKGDLTRFTHYSTMVESLDILEELFGTTIEDVATIRLAMNNLIANKDNFAKAYIDESAAPVYLYQLTVLACLQSISLMISSYLNFIKTPDESYTIEIAVKNTKQIKTMDSLCLQSLKSFNEFCLQNGVKHMVYGSKQLMGTSIALGGVVSVGVIVTLMILIIPVIRELIYQFYHSRTTISNYIDTQIGLIELHHSTDTINGGVKVIKKQEKVIKNLRKVSDFIKVDVKNADNKAEKDIKTEKIKAPVEPNGVFEPTSTGGFTI